MIDNYSLDLYYKNYMHTTVKIRNIINITIDLFYKTKQYR